MITLRWQCLCENSEVPAHCWSKKYPRFDVMKRAGIVSLYPCHPKAAQLSTKSDLSGLKFLLWEKIRVHEWVTGFPRMLPKSLTSFLPHPQNWGVMQKTKRWVGSRRTAASTLEGTKGKHTSSHFVDSIRSPSISHWESLTCGNPQVAHEVKISPPIHPPAHG